MVVGAVLVFHVLFCSITTTPLFTTAIPTLLILFMFLNQPVTREDQIREILACLTVTRPISEDEIQRILERITTVEEIRKRLEGLEQFIIDALKDFPIGC